MSDANYRKPKRMIPPSISLARPKNSTLKPEEFYNWLELISSYWMTIHKRAEEVGLSLEYADESTKSTMRLLRNDKIIFEGIDLKVFDFIEAEIEDSIIINY